MKKIKSLIILILIFIVSAGNVNATINNNPPIADIYKEGIYHFETTSGNKMSLKLVTPDKPATLILIENSNRKLKYYIDFQKNSDSVEIFLDKPILEHTTVILGEGEIAFTFE